MFYLFIYVFYSASQSNATTPIGCKIYQTFKGIDLQKPGLSSMWKRAAFCFLGVSFFFLQMAVYALCFIFNIIIYFNILNKVSVIYQSFSDDNYSTPLTFLFLFFSLLLFNLFFSWSSFALRWKCKGPPQSLVKKKVSFEADSVIQ